MNGRYTPEDCTAPSCSKGITMISGTTRRLPQVALLLTFLFSSLWVAVTPASAAIGTRVTIVASPTSVSPGEAVRIYGRVYRTDTGERLGAGRPVSVQRRVHGYTTWATFARPLTDS